jgi:hypothetical protein
VFFWPVRKTYAVIYRKADPLQMTTERAIAVPELSVGAGFNPPDRSLEAIPTIESEILGLLYRCAHSQVRLVINN